MLSINSNDYVSAGFILTRITQVGFSRLGISFDPFESPHFPTWELGFEEFDEEYDELTELEKNLVAFGVPEWALPVAIDATIRKMLDDDRYVAPNGCTTREALRDLITNARLDPTPGIVVEFGVHRDHVQHFVHKHSEWQPSKASFRKGPGMFELVHRRNPLHPDGQPIGFEPLVFDDGMLFSWRESTLQEALRKLDSITNDYGLFDSLDMAMTAFNNPGADEIWLATDGKHGVGPCPVLHGVAMLHSMESVMSGAQKASSWDDAHLRALDIS